MERTNNSSAIAWVSLTVLWGWGCKGWGNLLGLFTSNQIKCWPLLHWSFFTLDILTPVFRIKKENHWWKTNEIKNIFCTDLIYQTLYLQCSRLTFHLDLILANCKKIIPTKYLKLGHSLIWNHVTVCVLFRLLMAIKVRGWKQTCSFAHSLRGSAIANT